tara:strand:+ start:516 stop:629 length:114 start_codon:yes stop_codon:yes gene_type:complete
MLTCPTCNTVLRFGKARAKKISADVNALRRAQVRSRE